MNRTSGVDGDGRIDKHHRLSAGGLGAGAKVLLPTLSQSDGQRQLAAQADRMPLKLQAFGPTGA